LNFIRKRIQNIPLTCGHITQNKIFNKQIFILHLFGSKLVDQSNLASSFLLLK